MRDLEVRIPTEMQTVSAMPREGEANGRIDNRKVQVDPNRGHGFIEVRQIKVGGYAGLSALSSLIVMTSKDYLDVICIKVTWTARSLIRTPL